MPVRLKRTKSLLDERQKINYQLKTPTVFAKHVPGKKTEQGLLTTAQKRHHELAERREKITAELAKREPK